MQKEDLENTTIAWEKKCPGQDTRKASRKLLVIGRGEITLTSEDVSRQQVSFGDKDRGGQV